MNSHGVIIDDADLRVLSLPAGRGIGSWRHCSINVLHLIACGLGLLKGIRKGVAGVALRRDRRRETSHRFERRDVGGALRFEAVKVADGVAAGRRRRRRRRRQLACGRVAGNALRRALQLLYSFLQCRRRVDVHRRRRRRLRRQGEERTHGGGYAAEAGLRYAQAAEGRDQHVLDLAIRKAPAGQAKGRALKVCSNKSIVLGTLSNLSALHDMKGAGAIVRRSTCIA